MNVLLVAVNVNEVTARHRRVRHRRRLLPSLVAVVDIDVSACCRRVRRCCVIAVSLAAAVALSSRQHSFACRDAFEMKMQ